MPAAPAWVSSAIAGSYDLLQDRVPPDWMPKLDDVRATRGALTGKIARLGCGRYGCVMGTLDPDVVLKATTDRSESEFAARHAAALVEPICVEYHMVISLAAKHQGHPIFLLWREAAEDVGKLGLVLGGWEKGQPGFPAERAIHEQHEAAAHAYELIARGQDARAELVVWRDKALAMGRVAPELAFVARGMVRVFDEQGILISDVHGGNLGRVRRDGKDVWLITDPGNIIMVDDAPPARATRNPPATRTRDQTFAEVRSLFAEPGTESLPIIMDIAKDNDANALDFLVAFSEEMPDQPPRAIAPGTRPAAMFGTRGLDERGRPRLRPTPGDLRLPDLPPAHWRLDDEDDHGVFELGDGRPGIPMRLGWNLTFKHGYMTALFFDWNGHQWVREMAWARGIGGRIAQCRRTVALAMEVIAVMKQHHQAVKPAIQQAFVDKAIDRFDAKLALELADSARIPGEIRRGDLIKAVRTTDDPTDLVRGDLGEVQAAAPGKIDVYFAIADTDVEGMSWPHPDFALEDGGTAGW